MPCAVVCGVGLLAEHTHSVARGGFWQILFERPLAAQQHLEDLRASKTKVRPEAERPH